MSYLWAGMLILGLVYGTLTGNLSEVSEAVISSSKEAVTLCITMAGITAMWTGMLRIAQKSGMVEALAGKLRPILKFLFPDLDPASDACAYISMNFLSNMMGLGAAATASGLKAFQELDRLNREECRRLGENQYRAVDLASPSMCTFLIINVSSLQLIPMSMIAYRAQYGSVSPTAIAAPGLLVSAVSTAVAVVFCKLMNRRKIT
jgi:spore maturation protein A